MKIYIAAKFSQRTELRMMLPLFAKYGIKVTSSWITEDEADFHELQHQDLKLIGYRDISDIRAADVVVLDTRKELSEGAGGGREFEAGFGKSVHGKFWIVGPPRNPFHCIATESYIDWEEFIYGNRAQTI